MRAFPACASMNAITHKQGDVNLAIDTGAPEGNRRRIGDGDDCTIGAKRRRPRSPRPHIALVYSEGCRIVPAPPGVVGNNYVKVAVSESSHQQGNVLVSLFSVLSRAHSATGKVLESLRQTIRANFMKLPHDQAQSAANNSPPPKLVISFSQDEDMSIDDATSISLSGVSSLGIENNESAAWITSKIFVCMFIAAVLAFAHTFVSTNDATIVQLTNLSSGSLANEKAIIVQPMGEEEQIIAGHSTFIHEKSAIFGTRAVPSRDGQKPSRSTTNYMSSIAKDRAKKRLENMEAKALEGAKGHLFEQAKELEYQTRQLMPFGL